mmetsp:Transcript_31878/g.74767  ORF Transcript_31878/g.74767 Transcript_31878/m.74767 type:complete len:84 (-) Transcript_31878:10-261(-)
MRQLSRAGKLRDVLVCSFAANLLNICPPGGGARVSQASSSRFMEACLAHEQRVGWRHNHGRERVDCALDHRDHGGDVWPRGFV